MFVNYPRRESFSIYGIGLQVFGIKNIKNISTLFILLQKIKTVLLGWGQIPFLYICKKKVGRLLSLLPQVNIILLDLNQKVIFPTVGVLK